MSRVNDDDFLMIMVSVIGSYEWCLWNFSGGLSFLIGSVFCQFGCFDNALRSSGSFISS